MSSLDLIYFRVKLGRHIHVVELQFAHQLNQTPMISLFQLQSPFSFKNLWQSKCLPRFLFFSIFLGELKYISQSIPEIFLSLNSMQFKIRNNRVIIHHSSKCCEKFLFENELVKYSKKKCGKSPS